LRGSSTSLPAPGPKAASHVEKPLPGLIVHPFEPTGFAFPLRFIVVKGVVMKVDTNKEDAEEKATE
jgi:hypothetical protein